MSRLKVYPVIDLFAGPGGLSEGFSSFHYPHYSNKRAFETVLSIEKDIEAHSTLKLRHFFRAFNYDAVPDNYYRYLHGDINLKELYLFHPKEEAVAEQRAWLCTLGETPDEIVKGRISKAVGNSSKWVLVGGPPCQAYSLVGRARMMGTPGFETDPRHFLYKQYLRILADHKPPVFVLENVKGLLSAKVDGDLVIKNILHDLTSPEEAIYKRQGGVEYRLYSLAEGAIKTGDADASSFMIRAEDHGVPQSRHRIFIVGIRRDIGITPGMLQKSNDRLCAEDVIGDLPPIRSFLSQSADSDELWKQTIAEIKNQKWFIDGKLGEQTRIRDYAETMLSQLCIANLKTNSSGCTTPTHLSDWFSDSRLKSLSSHESRQHMSSDLHRYFFAASYASVQHASPLLSDFPEELLPRHKNVDLGKTGKMFGDRFRVQLPDEPSATVTSHMAKDGHYFIHYDPVQCRSLTVREAARLQTFPDNYKFEGSRTAQYRQVGNAVPPLLANRIAEVILEVLEGIK